MTQIATLGHNNPPDPIDEAIAPHSDIIAEAEAWLDGKPVETEAQMQAADALIKGVKAARKAVDDARDTATKPLHEAWKTEVARWKPTQDDLDRIVKGLVAMVDGFKRALAAQKAAAAAKAREDAEATARASWEASQAAWKASDIEALRAADQAKLDAEIAAKKAAIASKDTVKGLRWTVRYEITDHRGLLHYIAQNDREAMTLFIEAWAQRNHKEHRSAPGLRVWDEQVAV